MAIVSAQKRLDQIEISLTPKEWVIRLAEDMREHPSQKDFWNEVERREYRDLSFFRPFFKLSQQAEAQYPGKRGQDIEQRIQLDQKLRTEFQTLKIFVGGINQIVENMCERIGAKIEVRDWMLNILLQ